MIQNLDKKDFLNYLVDNDIINFYWIEPGDTIIEEYTKIEFKYSFTNPGNCNDFLLYYIEYISIPKCGSKGGSLDISILHTYLSEKRNKKLEIILN